MVTALQEDKFWQNIRLPDNGLDRAHRVSHLIRRTFLWILTIAPIPLIYFLVLNLVEYLWREISKYGEARS